MIPSEIKYEGDVIPFLIKFRSTERFFIKYQSKHFFQKVYVKSFAKIFP